MSGLVLLLKTGELVAPMSEFRTDGIISQDKAQRKYYAISSVFVSFQSSSSIFVHVLDLWDEEDTIGFFMCVSFVVNVH